MSAIGNPDHQIAELQRQVVALTRELGWAQFKIQSLEERLRQQLIARFGPRSENLTNLQLMLLNEEPGVTLDEVAAEAGREPLAGEPATTEVAAHQRQKRRPHPGRQELPAHLPRQEEVIP